MSACERRDPCLYCDAVLAAGHEHDHMPIPAEVGGAIVFCVCRACHDLKDRFSVEEDAAAYMSSLASDWIGFERHTRILLAKMMSLIAVQGDRLRRLA